ncbi:MAG: hypothetical protein O2931_15635, partial [Planctomycetota bacterium]|nr:hypothetical protein [Planctomycetota bacterium]
FDFRLPVAISPRDLEPQPIPGELKIAPMVDPRQFELPKLEPPSAPWRPLEESPNVRRVQEWSHGTRGENFNGYSTPPTQRAPHTLGTKRPSEWSVNKWQSVSPSPPPSPSRLGWK